MLTGTIEKIGDYWYIKYSTTFENEPIQQTLWWKVLQVERKPMGTFPTAGETVTRTDGGSWNSSGCRLYVDGKAPAEFVERVPVPCPNTRGKPTRWNSGRWEKLMARGWVAA